jgi:hypothetical protein
MIAAATPTLAEEARLHWREARELHLIFATIYRKSRLTRVGGSHPQSDEGSMPGTDGVDEHLS